MRRLTIIALAASLSTASGAAPQVERVRGTIVSVDDSGLVIKSDDGRSETVALKDDTKFASVVKSSLDAIKDGVFIGTATKEGDPPIAIEVVLFPEAMRGTGEGHYPWDEIQDTTTGGTPKVRSSMTNGTVKSSAGSGASKVKSAMTNGTVAKSGGDSGQRTITVFYGQDSSQTISVPPSAPIVAFEAADRSIVAPGAKAFVVAAKEDGKLTARRVAVGQDGLRPPM